MGKKLCETNRKEAKKRRQRELRIFKNEIKGSEETKKYKTK